MVGLMSSSFLSIDLTTALLIFLFTFVFDLVDLGFEEEINSISFVLSATYGIYFAYRVIFGLAAAMILKSAEITKDPLLLSVLSVISSASILQNFSLKIGGNQLINFNDLFQHYRERMIAVVGQKEKKKLEKRKLRTERTLAQREIGDLERILTLVIAEHGKREEWKKMKKEYLEYVNEISEEDKETKRYVIAKVIASIDPLYAEVILEEQKSEQRD